MTVTADPILIRRHPAVLAIQRGLSACRLRTGDRILLALSAGPDSTALLFALHALATRPRWALDLHVAHVHHHLRGPDADADADLAARLASDLHLPFHLRHIHPADHPGNTEANSRTLRYAALADLARIIDADAVATAHHLHDQLETLLLRLMRDSSPASLAAMSPRRPLAHTHLIRPMLSLRPSQARDLLAAFDIPFRIDHSNADLTRSRAALRHQVLPPLLAAFPQGDIKAAEAADLLRHARRSHLRRAHSWITRHVTFTGATLCPEGQSVNPSPTFSPEGQSVNPGATLCPEGQSVNPGPTFSPEGQSVHAPDNSSSPPSAASLPRSAARSLDPYTLATILLLTTRRLNIPTRSLNRRTLSSIAHAALAPSNEPRTFHLPAHASLSLTPTHLTWFLSSPPSPDAPHPSTINKPQSTLP